MQPFICVSTKLAFPAFLLAVFVHRLLFSHFMNDEIPFPCGKLHSFAWL